MPSSIKVLSELSASDLRGWFSNAASGEANSDSADREQWSLVDQFENRIDKLSSINSFEGSIFDQINFRAEKSGIKRGDDHLAFQEQSSILNVRRNNPDDIAQSNGIRATGGDKEWTHLSFDFPKNLTDAQKHTYRDCAIRGLNQPHLDVKVSGKNPLQTGEGHVALLASDPHTTQGHEDHFHLFVHCHAYDANNKEVSKRIDWSIAEIRRQAVGSINKELQKAGFIQDVDARGFSNDPESVIDFSTSTHSLANSTVAQKQLLQQAGITPQIPARTVTGQSVTPAAPAITDPEASKIRDGIETVEIQTSLLLMQVEKNKILLESLTHGANAAEQLTQAREERMVAVREMEGYKETLEDVQGKLAVMTETMATVTEKLAQQFDPDVFEGQELTLEMVADALIAVANDTQSALETEESAHKQTQGALDVATTSLSDMENKMVEMADELSTTNVTLTATKQDLAGAHETIAERDDEIAKLTERLEQLETKYTTNIGETALIKVELEVAKSEKAEMEVKFNDLLGTLEFEQKNVAALENIIQNAASRSGVEYTNAAETVKNLSEVLVEKQAMIDKLTIEVEKSIVVMTAKDVQIETLSEKLADATDHVNDLKAMNVSQASRLDSMENRTSEMMVGFQEMMKSQKELTSMNGALKEELVALRAERDTLSNRLSEIGVVGELDAVIKQEEKVGKLPALGEQGGGAKSKPAEPEFDAGAKIEKTGMKEGELDASFDSMENKLGIREKKKVIKPEDEGPKQK